MNRRRRSLFVAVVMAICYLFTFSGCGLVPDVYNNLKNVGVVIDFKGYEDAILVADGFAQYELGVKDYTYATKEKVLSVVFDELRRNYITDIRLNEDGEIISVDGVTCPLGMEFMIFTNDILNQERYASYHLYEQTLYAASYSALQMPVKDGGYYVIQLVAEVDVTPK